MPWNHRFIDGSKTLRLGLRTFFCALLLFSTTVTRAHLCGPPQITLTLGQTNNLAWQITADLTEILSDYNLVATGDPNVATVSPTTAFKEHHGVWTFTPVGVGETRFRMHWSYAATGASGDCEVLVRVVAAPQPQSTVHSSVVGDPVWGSSGEYYADENDLILAGPIPLVFKRHYGSQLAEILAVPSSLGRNWMHSYDVRAEIGPSRCRIVLAEGRSISFVKGAAGTWELEGSKETSYQWRQQNSTFLLLHPSLSLIYQFNADGRLDQINDFNGNTVRLTYSGHGLSLVEDTFGRRLQLTYDAKHRLNEVKDGWGRALTFGYDQNDLLISATGVNGRTTRYSYIAKGNRTGLMVARQEPKGNTRWTNTYDDLGRVIRQTDANGSSFQFGYAAQAGDPTTVVTPLNATVRYHHKAGAGTQRTGPDGKSLSAEYDSAGRRTKITDAEGRVSAVRFDNNSGLVASYTDPLGQAWSYTYASRQQNGFPVHELAGMRYPDGASSSNTYDANGNLLAFVNRAGDKWQYGYNERGQILTVTNPAGASIAYTYNPNGTAASLRDCSGNTTKFSYDNFQRLTSVTYPDNSTARFEYDASNNIVARTDEEGRRTAYEYDENGNLLKVIDAANQATTYAYDLMDRVVTTRDPLGRTTTLAYTAMNQIAQVTGDANDVSKFTYNNLGQLTAFTDAEGNVWKQRYDSEGNLLEYVNPLDKAWRTDWDGFGRRTTETDPLGNTTRYNYDSLGRLTKIVNALGQESSYTFNALDMLTEVRISPEIQTKYGVDKLGMVTAVTGPDGNQSNLFYDCNGQTLSRTDGAGHETVLRYDNRKRLAQMIYPARLGDATFQYDRSGLLTNTQFSADAAQSFRYNSLRQLISAPGVEIERNALGAVTRSNGIQVEYDSNGRIAKITFDPNRAVSYTYDRRDLVKSVTDWTGATTTFEYDAIGRLTALRRPNGIATLYHHNAADRVISITDTNQSARISSIVLERDGLGQITSATRQTPLTPKLSASTWSYAYQPGDRITGYEYDGLGQLLNDGQRSYRWDQAHRLIAHEAGGKSVTSTYDGLGSRISRTSEGVTREFVWNYALSLPSISVFKQNSQAVSYFVHTPAGKLLYSVEGTSSIHRYYHYDEMGNTSFLTDDAGKVTDAYAYTPYGALLDAQTSSENPFTFGGAFGVFQEPNSSLHAMRARYYDSQTARFLSPDPIWPDIASIKTLNPYQYAAQNPLLYHDPRGTREFDLFFFESDAESTDLQIAAFWNLYRDRNAQWASSAQEIQRSIDDYLKDSTCDCVRSITFVGHGVRGQAPFGLSLSTAEFHEKNLKKRVFPQHARDAWMATTTEEARRGYMRRVAEDYYREQNNDPTAQLMVLLMNVRWCPENQGVYFWSCNLLGSWGWADDEEVARFQQLSNRLGIQLNGSKSAIKTTGRFGSFGFTHTVVPNPRAW